MYSLKHIITHVFVLKIDYPIQIRLIQNFLEYIDNIITTNDEDIPYLCYATDSKAFESLSEGHYNIICIFAAYFQ